MTLRDSLHLVCTDRGQHGSTQVARVTWTPDLAGGAAVWSPGDSSAKPEAIRENTRTTRSGEVRVTKREPVEVVTRADGGQTFHLPPCPRCHRRIRLRDDTLDKLRALPSSSCDLSLLL